MDNCLLCGIFLLMQLMLFFLSDLHHYDFRGLTNNRPYSRYPPSLHARKDWWDKSYVTWFRRRQKSVKTYRYKKSQLSLHILDRKWRNFKSLRRCFQIIGGRDHFFLLDAAATVDVLTASRDDVKLVEARTVHFSSLKLSSFFEKIKNLDRDYSYWQILSPVCHLKVHLTLLSPHLS